MAEKNKHKDILDLVEPTTPEGSPETDDSREEVKCVEYEITDDGKLKIKN